MPRILIFITLLCSLFRLGATHIAGGEMTYTYLGNNQYKLRLDIYMDCLNGSDQAIQQDYTAYISIFNGGNNKMLSGYPKSVTRSGPKRIQKTNYNCIKVAPNACVDHYWYELTVTLPPNAGGYYVSYQRCCRNGSVSNLSQPGSTGANFWTHIPDANDFANKVGNTSAVFKELPPNFLCTNTPLKFDHSATDADGDSLTYELYQPYKGASSSDPQPTNAFQMQQPPFSQVNFLWPTYSYDNPINGNPPMSIDTFTGLLTLTPTRAGQYVVGIKVKEYRNGVLIGETLRDYQFNVQACVIDVVAGYFVPKLVCGLTYQFQNQSAGAQRYHWDFGIDSLSNDTSASGNPQYTFPKAGSYKVKLFAYKNTCVDSFVALINVVDPILPKLPKDTILCAGSKIIIRSATKGDSYRWSTGSYDDSLVITQPGQYWVRQYIKSCYWHDTIVIGSDTDRIQVVGDTVFCTYDPIVQNLRASWPAGSSAWSKGQLEWSTNQSSPSIRVTQPGFYVLKGTTENKCVSTDTGFIYLFPPVEVDIRDTLFCRETNIEFDSKNPSPAITEWSTGAKGRYWTTNGTGSYWVRVTIGLCFDQDTFQLGYHPIEFQMGPDLRFCSGIDTTLTVNQKGLSNVVWNNEILGPNFRLTKPGKVKAEWVNSQGCYEADSLMVSLFPLPGLNLGSDTVLCLSENPTLDAGPGMAVYRWSTGASTQRIVAYDSGQYVVWVKDQEGCWNSDTVWIDKKKDLFPSVIYMPTAFTPNGDGRNDFYPMNQYKVKGSLYNVKLYNRWGEKLAELKSPDFNWDGRINGEEAPQGVYVYLATWIGCDNERRTLMGNFTLLR